MGNLKQSNLPFVACFIDSVSFLTQSPLIFQYFILPRMPIRVGRVKYVNPGRKVNPSDSSDPSANSNLNHISVTLFIALRRNRHKHWQIHSPGERFLPLYVRCTIQRSKRSKRRWECSLLRHKIKLWNVGTGIFASQLPPPPSQTEWSEKYEA